MNYGMSEDSEPQSLQVVVVRGFARNYRSYLHPRKKHGTDENSNLKRIYSEEVEPARQHPHLADNTGFS